MDVLKKRWAIIVFLALLIIGGSFYGSWQKAKVPEETSGITRTDPSRPGEGGDSVVYISGGVNKPGVFTMKPGSRIADVVEAAGGLTAGGDATRVNLAQPLKDGMHIYIPAGAAGGQPSASGDGARATAVAQAADKVSINTADRSELERLPGVGPVIAGRIVEYREANGPFRDLAEIRKVPGIGEAKYRQLKDRISL